MAKKRKSLDKLNITAIAKKVRKSSKKKPKEYTYEPKFNHMISTGSTLLDLAISGGRIKGGGIPGGVMCEFFGASQTGKTAILAELSTSTVARGGEVEFKDPEARLDRTYCKIYGLNRDDYGYSKPDTVEALFNAIEKWKPKNPKIINLQACDSLAALSTELEMGKGDKMGMRRAKQFSEGCRKTCRIIEKNGWVVACSNQVRQGDYGDITPGGKAIPFYSSIRIKNKLKRKLERKRVLKGGKTITKIFGIEIECTVIKSVDEPYRTAPVHIVFNYGIDDVRANLQWIKDMTGATKYDACGKEYQQLEKAIAWIEEKNLERKLQKRVIKLWHGIEKAFKVERKKKKRR